MSMVRPKVLGIDDRPDNLVALRAVVEDAVDGAIVLTALSGPDGLALARSEDPDVVLLDLLMPGMDGFEVCRRIKDDPALRHLPVVFLTADGTRRESRVRALEAGAEGFLAKPVEAPELAAAIRAMARLKRAGDRERLEKERLSGLVAARTEALEAELAARRETEAALRESELRFRRIFEESPMAYQSLDAEGRILEVNPAWLALSGHTREEVLGRPVVDLLAPGCRERFTESFRKFRLCGSSHGAEFELSRPDGSARVVVFDGVFVRGDDGAPRHTHCVLHDVTESRQTEAALASQVEQLRRWQEATLGREGRILELKREVNALLERLGEPARYPSAAGEPVTPHGPYRGTGDAA